MKKIIALIGIVLLANSVKVVAQRNANQKNFKTQNELAPSKSGILNDEEYLQYNAAANGNNLSNGNGTYNQAYNSNPSYYQSAYEC
jgi:hypothetical protein